MPGQYTFPFNIAIPYGCPSSAFFTGTDSAVASIKYSIKAVLNPHINVRVQEMEFKQSLIIREKASIVQQDLFSSAEMEINSCCCCCSKGRASLTTRFEKNAYTGVETCRALCEINNENCTIPVVRIKINIKQFVVLTAYSSVYRRNFKKGERVYEGVGANAKAIGAESRYLEIPLYEMKNVINRNEYTDFGFYDEDMYLAQTLQPTTTGLHLNITYQLAVELDYETYCASIPISTIPLFIQAPELQNFQIVQAPPGWNPQVFDAANFALPVPSMEMRVDMAYPVENEHQRLLEEEKKYDSNPAYIPNQNYAPGMPPPAPVPVPVPSPYGGAPGQMSPLPVPVPVPVAAPPKKSEWDV